MNQLSSLNPQQLPDVKIVSERFPIASVEYSCRICGRKIAIGTQYWRLVYRDRSLRDRKHNIRTSHIHLRCPQPASGEAQEAQS